jgi:hypothetical protein
MKMSPLNIHGPSVDLAMPLVSTKYCCVIDSDAAFLNRGFDVALARNLVGKHGLISTHERGFKKKNVRTNHADLMFFETALAKRLKISFSADHANGIDTGGKFGLALKRHGRKVKYLDRANEREQIPGLSRQYKLDGKLIFSHMGPRHKQGSARAQRGICQKKG